MVIVIVDTIGRFDPPEDFRLPQSSIVKKDYVEGGRPVFLFDI